MSTQGNMIYARCFGTVRLAAKFKFGEKKELDKSPSLDQLDEAH